MGLADKAALKIVYKLIGAGRGGEVAVGILRGAEKEGRKYAIKQGFPDKKTFEAFCNGEIDRDKEFQKVMQQVNISRNAIIGQMLNGYDRALGEKENINIPKKQPCPKCQKWVKHKEGIYYCSKCHYEFEITKRD